MGRITVILLVSGMLAISVGAETLELSVGEQRILPAGSATRLVAGNPAVLSVTKLDDRRILLFGRKPGTTQITVVHDKGSKTINVRVLSKEASRFLSECAALMQEPCSYLQASVVAGKVVVTGVVAEAEVYDKVRKIKKAFPNVNYLLEVQPRVLDVLVPIINKEFQKAGLKDAKVTRIGSRLIIDGLVEDEGEKRRAEIIVEEYYGKITGE